MAESHRWEWVPLVSIGGLRFNEPLSEDLGTLKLQRVEDSGYDSGDNIDSFREEGGDTEIELENGRVDTVYCRANFFFKGRDLIGLSAEEVMDIVGGNWELDEEDGDGRIFNEDDLEIMIWEADGAVWSIIVSGPIEED